MAKASHARVQEKQPVKKSKRRYKGLIITLVALLSVVGVLMISLGVLLNFVKTEFDYDYDPTIDKMTDDDLGISNQNQTLTKKVINIALFGVDSRSANGIKGNTDSIMIISIDQIHGKIKLISVMRDTLVYLPDNRGYAKLNAAFAYGGAELALKTLNQSFNLNIRDYAVVNFGGMVDIIDAVGGVEVEVTEGERQNANGSIREMAYQLGKPATLIQKTGTQTLNGMQAVAWARVRYAATADGVSDDYGRTDRQRIVMEQLFNKALSAGVSQYPAMIKALLPCVQTSLSYTDILDMAGILVGGTKFEQTRVPLTEYVINGGFADHGVGSTVYYNLEYAGKIIHAFIYDDMAPELYIEQNGIDKTRWAG